MGESAEAREGHPLPEVTPAGLSLPPVAVLSLTLSSWRGEPATSPSSVPSEGLCPASPQGQWHPTKDMWGLTLSGQPHLGLSSSHSFRCLQ